MKLITAIFTHTWFALNLKHDGTGLPTKLPAALLLVSLYIALSLANHHFSQAITLETLLGLSFIGQIYLFSLRTKLIGLFLVIGIIVNALKLIFSALFGAPESESLMLLFAEYIMIFAALVNTVKSNAHSA